MYVSLCFAPHSPCDVLSYPQVTAEGEILVKFALQFKKLEDAVAAVIGFFGECALLQLQLTQIHFR